MTENLPAVFENGHVPAVFSGRAIDNDALAGGVSGGYAVLSIKGKVFRIKYKGEEHPVTDTNGDAVQSLECVLVAANPNLTKQFYATGYEEGSTAAPDCYSLDGKVPADAVAAPIHSNCATCPKNQFGSRISESGKKAKACSDTRRMAIVPLFDLPNEAFGGPMLLRVPPSSLSGLAAYGQLLKGRGYNFYAVATRIGFDIDAAHPLPTFRAIRPLTDDEAEIVAKHMESDTTQRVLAEFQAEPSEKQPAEGAQEEVFEQPTPAAKPATPAPAPKPAAPRPAAATVSAPKPTVAAPRPVVAPVKPTVQAAAKPAAPKPAAPKPAAPVQAAKPSADSQAAPDSTGDLEEDIRNILAGLGAKAAVAE